MIELERSVEVERAAGVAFAFLARPERFPEWQPGIRSVERTSPGELAVGSTYRIVIEGPGGVTIQAHGRVLAFEPPTDVAVEADSTMLRLRGAYRVEPLSAGRCVIHVNSQLQPLGFLRFMEGRIRSEIETELPAALARLRAAIEADTAA